MRNQDTVSAMLCPVCKTGLSMSDRNGVEIDFCPACRGVWLDRGELDKIIDRSVDGSERNTNNRSTSDRRDGAGGLMGMASSLLKGDDDRHRGRDGNDRYDNDNDRYDSRRKKKSLFSEFFE
ncbi:MAG: Zn-finger nucleic acid-binding protein [Loktanella salsilacus]|jgi:Zn-finger nucleic acid-binding protein|uniref:TFIIB-type zinc ribbon-containing protein n=1 Tax=Loktanella salsilacus TaxID=195913 RepID=UPI003AD563C5